MSTVKPVPRRRRDPAMANYVYKSDDRVPSERTGQPAIRTRAAASKPEEKPGK